MVPHLITALEGPMNELEQRLLEATPVIERWLRLEWMEHEPLLYSSVDIRNAGFKVAVVGNDLYPSGWHNLSADTLPLAVQAAQAGVEKVCPEARNLMIVPKNGQLSSFDVANLLRLKEIFSMAGLDTRFGSIDPAVKSVTTIQGHEGQQITLEPVVRDHSRLTLKHFDPCTILLNNELSAGTPGILEDLREQYLLPPLQAGWTERRKSRYFQNYQELCKRFGKLVGIDPWLINPLYAPCGTINLRDADDRQTLRGHVDTLLGKIRRKYKEYGINEKPFVVIKAEQGSRSTGVLTIRDSKDLIDFQPECPDHVLPKGELIAQEGLLTNERIHDASAEPVIYMMDRYVVGGFYRVHAQRDPDENLRVPGAHFVPLPFAPDAHLPQPGNKSPARTPNRFYMYGVIARLGMAAASYELEATDPELLELV